MYECNIINEKRGCEFDREQKGVWGIWDDLEGGKWKEII